MSNLRNLEIPTRVTAPAALTMRELEVLTGISYGHTNAQIGRKLGGLSADTVKSHVRRLFRKLGTDDRAHAVRLGLELGLLTTRAPLREAPPVHPDAVPDQLVPAGGLHQPTPRNNSYRDTHIAACMAAEACPCRLPARRRALAG